MVAWLESLIGQLAAAHGDELMVTSRGQLWLQRGSKGCQLPGGLPFAGPSEWQFALQDFADQEGVRLDPFCPAAGGSLAGGALRWQALIPPVSPEGPVFILRQHRFAALALGSFGGCAQLKARLEALFEQGEALLLCGPTGSGKTSLLALLLATHARGQRVVLLEDFAELPLAGGGWLRLLAKPRAVSGEAGLGFAKLLQLSMRLRPDRIVLGELRGQQLRMYLQALSSGHQGCVATLHANSFWQVERRLEEAVGPGWHVAKPGGAARLWCALLERGEPPRLAALSAFSYQGAG